MKKTIKTNKGITLVSLVVTIIVLIILAGVSINMTLGENGIITIAKSVKENTLASQIEEQERLNELYTQIEQEGGIEEEISYEAIAKLNDFKKKVADYIEEAGGIKPEYTADAETFGQRIKGIVKEVTKDATATAGDIVKGKIAWVNGNKIIGTNNNTVVLGEVRIGTADGSSYSINLDSNKEYIFFVETVVSWKSYFSGINAAGFSEIWVDSGDLNILFNGSNSAGDDYLSEILVCYISKASSFSFVKPNYSNGGSFAIVFCEV